MGLLKNTIKIWVFSTFLLLAGGVSFVNAMTTAEKLFQADAILEESNLEEMQADEELHNSSKREALDFESQQMRMNSFSIEQISAAASDPVVLYSQPDDSVEIPQPAIASFDLFTGASGSITELQFAYNDKGNASGHWMGVSVVDRTTGTNYYAYDSNVSTECGNIYESTGVNDKVLVTLGSDVEYREYPCTGDNLILDPTHTYGVALFRNSGPFGSNTQKFYGSGLNNNDVFLHVAGEPPALARNPVLIVPGVLGTEIFKGTEILWMDFLRTIPDLDDEFMDSLQFNPNLSPFDAGLSLGKVIGKPVLFFDQTEKLIEDLESQSYTQGDSPNNDLFLFPYDWRYGVDTINIDALKHKIEDIKNQTGDEKVDVIAHSTGGLLVKKYVIDNPSDHFIDKAVFVGVPNTGAPKAIKVLLQGDGFGNPFMADSEMKKIASNLPVVYDLAPSQEYYNQKGSYVRVINQTTSNIDIQDLDFPQTISFMDNDHDLNSLALSNSQNLHNSTFDNYDLQSAGVDLYNIVGCTTATIGKIVETRFENFLGHVRTTHEIRYVPGDGTVPLESATNLPVDPGKKYFSLKTSHAQMMTEEGTRQQIINLISGSELEMENGEISQDIEDCGLNGRAISVFSPLSLGAIDGDGNYSGLDEQGNIINEIPNADVNVIGEHKFLYLPTGEGQEYTVSLKGTGEGFFTLESSEIVENQITYTETFSEIPVTTNSAGNLDLEDSILSLDINGDEVNDIELDADPGETLKMPYIFSGFLQPINYTNHQVGQDLSVFKAGSTVPVKFQLKKHDGTIVQAESMPIWLPPQKGSKMNETVDETVYITPGSTGNTYRLENKQYIYNWSTKGLQAGYWYKIYAKLDDGNIYSVTVGLR